MLHITKHFRDLFLQAYYFFSAVTDFTPFSGLSTAADPQSSPVCFLCDNGKCIQPSLPVYNVERGMKWWWLCDGYKHCADGTDEAPGKQAQTRIHVL